MTDERPEPTLDPPPEEGPGGVDAVPDWEAAGPDPVTPDPPISAQVEEVPDAITEPEPSDSDDTADEAGVEGGDESASGEPV